MEGGSYLQDFSQDLIDQLNRLSSWTVDGDFCHWLGVVCHNLTAHVHELHLRTFPPSGDTVTDEQVEAYVRSMFGGKLNPSLLDLKHLNYFDLSFNNFSASPIPEFLGSMKSLTSLNLSNAGFVGLIPHQLGNLSNLLYLNLEGYGSNDLYVNNLEWLFGLPLLQHLDMSYVNLSKASDWVQLTNTLPSLLDLRLHYCQLRPSIPPIPTINSSSLLTLDLSDNYFENTSIPSWILGLRNLVSLDLSYNNFQGSIPVDLQNMTSLSHLYLSGNNFNSSIPNWLYSFSRLEFLNLGSNNLQGTISSAIGNLTSAISIDLSYNELGGKLPVSFGNLCNLREISLSSNKWSQEISEILESLSGCLSDRLEILDLSYSQLHGPLTDELGVFKNLVHLSLWNNSISGPIPVSLGILSSLTFLDLSYNQFNETLPQNFGQLSKLETLYIDSNMLEGVVSEVHFSNLTSLIQLYASRNKLTLEVSYNWNPPFQLVSLSFQSWNLGPNFPAWLCSQRHLQRLDISNARIFGVVPPPFWNLSSQLVFLNLSQNLLYGEIVNGLMNLSSNSVIDLSSNHFNCSLPYVSSNVTMLDLSNNSFSGSISHFLCYKMNEPKQMQLLNLGKNHLSGKIPNCWMKWNNLKLLNLGINNFTGNIPTSLGSLTLLKSLHLHKNKLSGKLPSSFQNCDNLMTIDVAENEFVGSIPSWIGHKCSNSMILSLRSNNFLGHVPEELCALTSLQILDLSCNKLFGSIPRCVKNFSAMATKDTSNYNMDFYDSMSYYGESFPLESASLVIKGQILEYSTILRLVKSIDLSMNSLSGEIPIEVTTLQGLQSLNLSYNLLIGSISENIGTMGSLESIDFSMNQLSGQIPSSMSSLTFLNHLNLSNNNLTGKIPLGTQLQSFNASNFIGNKLCGPPLANNCTTSGAKPNIDNIGCQDTSRHVVDWFYVSMALGFVVGFWSVCGPLLLNKKWRIMYFQFLDHMGYKLKGVVSL
nr:receptor-like protein EIX2 [Quercus suber]POE64646.1 lrr receptor-like serine/threonine-protein kinase gso2 [Quercus suber]